MKQIYKTTIACCLFVFTTLSSNAQLYTITTGLPNNIISGSATTITGLGDDNFVGPFNIGFNFTFFGNSYSQFYMSSNGFITFGSGATYSMGTIPSTSEPNNFIAYAATDQHPGRGTPTINYFISGTIPNRILVINYQNVQHYNFSSPLTSIQLQLFEGSGKIEIHNIQNISNGSSRTIGIENSTGTQGFSPSGMNNSSSISLTNQMIRFATCTPPVAPTISPTQSPVLCTGNSSTTLTATCQTGSLSWSTGATTSAISVSPSQTTIYTATCTENSCQTSSNVTVSVLQTPTISPNGTNYICTGNTLTLTTSSNLAGSSLQWYKDDSSIQNATNTTYIANSMGSFTVTATKDGCTTTSQATIINENSTIPSAPTITPSSTYTCLNSPITLSATGCGGTVLWSTGASGSTLNTSTAGTYSATCRVDGCVSTTSNSATINIATVSINAPNGTQICPSSITQLQSVVNVPNGFTYQWLLNGSTITNAGTSNTFNADVAGTYSLRITLPNSCTVTSNSVGVSVINAAVPTISVCANGSNSLIPEWNNAFGGINSDGLESIVRTNDGGFLLVGQSDSGISGHKTTPRTGTDTDLWIVKTDANRNKIWDVSFGGFYHDRVVKAALTTDGNIIIAGEHYRNVGVNDVESEYWIIKINNSGSLIWEKTFKGGVTSKNYLNSIQDILLLGDGYLIGGYSNGNINNHKSEDSKGLVDYWVIKTDLDGNKVWDKTFGGTQNDYLYSLHNTQGGFLLGGTSESFIGGDKSQNGHGKMDYWIVKIDFNGNKLWDKTIGALKDDILSDIMTANDGGFILSGYSDSDRGADKSKNSRGSQDFWIVKVDSNGNKDWDVTFGGTDSEYLSTNLALDDGYIIGGSTWSDQSGDIGQPRLGSQDILLIKIDNNGNKLWDRRFGSTGMDLLNTVEKIDDSIFIGGMVTYADRDVTSVVGAGDYWIAKLKNCSRAESVTTNVGDEINLTSSGCPGQVTWSSGQTTNEINIVANQNTTYTVSCVSNNNCTTTASVQVNVNCSADFKVSAQGNILNPVVCSASPSITLEATGCNSNILWSDGSTTSSITVSPTATINYSAICSGATCTAVTRSIQVTYFSNPTILATGSTTVCIGQTVSLSASTSIVDGQLQWYVDGNSITEANTLAYNASTSGNYTFKVFKDGCEAESNSINIIVNTIIPPKPTLVASTSYVCGQGMPVVLTASGCNGTVNWYRVSTSNNSWVNTPTGTTASAYIYGSSKYYITCTENACTSIESDTITVDYARVIVTAADNLICSGGSVLLSANVIPNTGISSYQWLLDSSSQIDGATQSTYTATTLATYNLQVTFSNGCVRSSSNSGGRSLSIQSYGTLATPVIKVTNETSSSPAVKVLDRRYGSSDFNSPNVLSPTSDKGYLIGGILQSGPAGGDFTGSSRGGYDYWVVKVDSNYNKLWDKSFGSPFTENLNEIIQNTDKSMLLIGQSSGDIDELGGKTAPNKGILDYANSYYPSDIWIVKLDSSGNKIWDKTYGGNLDENAIKSIKNPDNSFLIGGSTNSGIDGDVSQTGRGSNDFWALKLDAEGNKLWDKRFGGSSSDAITSILKTTNGYLLAGTSNSPQSGDKSQGRLGTEYESDIWIVSIDENGNKLWDKTFGTSSMDVMGTIVSANDGGYVFVLESVSTPKYIIYKIDNLGNVVWQKDILGSIYYTLKEIVPNNEGYLVLGAVASDANGNVTENGRGSLDYWLVQVDNNGNKLWDRRFGGSSTDFPRFLYKENNSSYIIGGYSQSPVSGEKTQPTRGNSSDSDYWLVKVNTNQEITQPASVNAGQTINLIANNCPGIVTWSGGTTTTGAIVKVSPNAPTTYTATCTAYGCSTSSNIQIGINCSANFATVAKNNNGNIINNPTVCAESPSVTLEATGCMSTITWSNGASGSTTSVSPTINTTYTATCSNIGCTSVTSSIEVKTFEIPTIIATGNTTFCIGGSVVLNAIAIGTGYNYLWFKDGTSTGITTSTFTATTSGAYTVSISKNGCSALSLETVVNVNTTIPSPPIFSQDTIYTCLGIATTLTANGCNGLVNWSNGDTGQSISVSTNSSVSLTATCTENTCISAASIPIRVLIGTVSILGEQTRFTCNDNISLTASAPEGVTMFEWLNDGTVLPNQNNSSIQVNTSGSYSVRVTLQNNCTLTSSNVVIRNIQLVSPQMYNIIPSQALSDTIVKFWDKTFGGASLDMPKKIIKTQDNNYLLVGISYSGISGNKKIQTKGESDIYVIKVDSLGNKIWEKSFGTSSYDEGVGAILSNDGNILVLGNSYTANDGDKTGTSLGDVDYWLIKIDNDGNKIWDKVYGSSEFELPMGILKTSDNNYLLYGSKITLNFANSRYNVIKIDEAGSVLWNRIYTGGNYDRLGAATKTHDGNYLITGFSSSGQGQDKSSPTNGLNDYWTLKIDNDGNKIWDKSYGGSGSDIAGGISVNNDGTIITSGTSYSPVSGSKTTPHNGQGDIWVVKTNENGDKIWDVGFGGTGLELLNYQDKSSTNNIILVGKTSSSISAGISESTHGANDGIIIEINSNTGAKIWDKRFGGTDDDEIVSFIEHNKNLYFLGNSKSEQYSSDKTFPEMGGDDYWLIGTKYVSEQAIIPATINQGQSINLVASNCQGNIVWSNGMSGASIVVSPVTNTNYTATCSAFGCSTASSIQVTVNSCSQAISLTQSDNIVSGTTNAPVVLKAQDTISAINTIGNPPANAVAEYKAGKSIMLNAGFKVEVGSIFKANISNTPCN